MKPTILDPTAAASLVPRLRTTRNPKVWVYRYTHPNGWRLSIATHAEPGSDKLSLGGFRIVPEERAATPGFDTDVEAIGLAIGMEEKVHWSRVAGVGGPLAAAALWGVLVAPRSSRQLRYPVRLVPELAVFGSAVAALLAVGQTGMGLALATLVGLHLILQQVLRFQDPASVRPDHAHAVGVIHHEVGMVLVTQIKDLPDGRQVAVL